MATDVWRVTFQPQGRAVHVLEGTTVLEAAAGVGLVIDTPCGGMGTCGKCRVRITQGIPSPSSADRRIFSEDELDEGWRLGCQARIACDMVIHIPPGSLFGAEHQIARDSTVGGPAEVLPAVRKVYVDLPPPTLEDGRADLLRLEEKTGPFKVDVATLRRVPAQLRAHGYKGTAVLSDHQLIDFEEGDTSGRCFGVAFDIGTTTIAASLVDLCTGRERAVVSRVNPQVTLGDDVLSRIRHSTSCPDCLEDLRRLVVGEAGSMIRALCDDAGVTSHDIYEATFAGNTTMQHLLCGVDPSSLGAVPFAPAYGRGLLLAARDVDIPINPHAMVYVFPVIGGFVGGDTVAGMLATRIDATDGPTLMVDIGTNGEIVLAHNGCLTAASTAAGPAFEGARISCGMRGTRGAIEKVVMDDDVRLGVIGNVAPIGICGSGLIDIAAGLLDFGLVAPLGHFVPPGELSNDVPYAIRQRVKVDDKGSLAFVLVDADDTTSRRPISMTQRDIRELQLGCGAIRAGVSILLRAAGLKPDDLATVLVAGGFGNYIRRDKAQRLGLLPPEIDHRRIHYVGNTALAGARWALLSVEARKHGEELARRTVHVELSTDSGFQAEFAEAMVFPDARKGVAYSG